VKKYDVVVIGASAAGITAGITAKRHYPGKSVLVIRKEQLVSIPCGIPYVFGVVGTPDKNLMPVDDLLPKNGIDTLVGNVERIDRNQRIVATLSGEQIEYQRLIIATGSDPIVPPIQGVDKKNIYVVRKDVPYLQEIVASVEKADNICIVGCGFIGVEIAEECKRRRPDVNVHIVEMMRHCLQLV
jgi:NADPH-dependent 2,4-dienoyl-CoA reductase/sulfur reductase-like enzyme